MRRRAGKGFFYLDVQGNRITDKEQIQRIRSLAIPPAYQQVWICPVADGHLQATGMDERKRKQYRYHPIFQEYQNQQKFTRIIGFAKRLPRIRQAVRDALRRRKLDREKILATAVFLLDTTAIRIGNRRYAEMNQSYGLTTLLKDEHVEVHDEGVRFEFVGKSGKLRRLSIKHPTVCKVLRNCQELPGEHLLSYLDEDGNTQRIGSHDVNEYLRQISGAEIFAKDFRTWGGSLAAFCYLVGEAGSSEKPTKKATVEAIRHASKVLGNTPATCRKYYVHPLILDVYLQNRILEFAPREESSRSLYPDGLKPPEKALLKLLVNVIPS